MSNEVTIYHNPRCTKSRQTLELLREKGVEPRVIEYLKTPPSAAEVEQLLGLLGLEPRELMRTSEAEYKDNNLKDDALSRAQLVEAFTRWPKLLQRPVVVAGNRAAIGRPPEQVLSIL